MTWARGLPSLNSGLRYFTVCLVQMHWLAAASAPFLEVHLDNGEMLFREKKAKQQFLNLMGESRVIQLPSRAVPSSLVMLLAAILLWKRKHVGYFPPWCFVWHQWQRHIPLLGTRWAWPAPSGHRTGLSPACMHSSHIQHCRVTDLARVC